MKVNMNIVQEKRSVGIFRKIDVYEIIMEVQFTEEEKYNIKKLGLGEYHFFLIPYLSTDKDMGGGGYEIRVKDLVKGKWFTPRYDTLLEANNAVQALEQKFRELKSHLTDAKPETRSLDL